MANDDHELWERMISKRRNGCECLDEHEIADLVETYKHDLPSPEFSQDLDASDSDHLFRAIESLLRKYFTVCSDEKVPPKTRRESYDCLRKILGDIDDKVRCKKLEKSKRQPSDVTMLEPDIRGKKFRRMLNQHGNTNNNNNNNNKGSKSPTSLLVNGSHSHGGAKPSQSVNDPYARPETSDLHGATTESTSARNEQTTNHMDTGTMLTSNPTTTVDNASAMQGTNGNPPVETQMQQHQQPTDSLERQPPVVEEDFAFQWSLFGLTPDDNDTERFGPTNSYLDSVRPGMNDAQYNPAMNVRVFMTVHEAKTRSRYVYESRNFLEKQFLNGNLCWLCHLCNVLLFDSDVQTHCGEAFHVEKLRNRANAMHDETLRRSSMAVAPQWDPRPRYAQPINPHAMQQHHHHVQFYQNRDHRHQQSYPGYAQRQFPIVDRRPTTRYTSTSSSWYPPPSSMALAPQAMPRQPQLTNPSLTQNATSPQNHASQAMNRQPQLVNPSLTHKLPQNGTSTQNHAPQAMQPQLANPSETQNAPTPHQNETSGQRDTSQSLDVLQLAEDVSSGLTLHSSETTICFSEDSARLACTVHQRSETVVSFRLIKLLNGSVAKQAFRRLETWEPFWKTESALGGRVTSAIRDSSPQTNMIRRATEVRFNFSNAESAEWLTSVKWGEPCKGNDRVLLLRMLPLNEGCRKRADCHVWPKGTFLQINGKAVAIEQRRQQHHNLNEWKGMCKAVNVSALIKDPAQLNTIQLCCLDNEPFVFLAAFCRQRTVKEIFQELLHSQSPKRITVISSAHGKERAVQFARHHKTVSIDSEDEDDNDEGKFIFTLTCPISKTIIQHPVRGKGCKHWQCFDLLTYISSNVLISGSRWRCAACEKFVALQNLEYCQFTRDLLVEFAQEVSTDRDRVEFCSDGVYRLLKERKLRFGKRKNAVAAAASTATATAQPASEEADVIELV